MSTQNTLSNLPMKIALSYFGIPFDGNPETLAEVIEAGIQPAVLAHMVDGEIREVLEGLQTFQMNLGSEGTERHWCKPEGGCDVHCQRARALMEKLGGPSGKGAGNEPSQPR